MLSSGISQVVYGLEVVQLSELFGGVEGLLTGDTCFTLDVSKTLRIMEEKYR